VLTVVSPDELPPILLDVPDPFLEQEAVHEAEWRLEAAHEERVRAELASEAAVLTDAGVEVTLHVRAGVPPDEIIRLATELGTDLIVIGSHGKRSLEELLLGSTVENVTKHAPCPVLVVR
jgi:nucleotide-binding universal stress UspA family protein